VLFWLGAGAYLNERLAEDAKARLKKGVIRYAVFVLGCMVPYWLSEFTRQASFLGETTKIVAVRS
jgi:hypothetical protein